jgi:hypothetical protein
MMAHTMPVHAFVDESRRGSLYFVAAAIAKPGNLRRLRRDLRGLLLPGQRELHFNDQQDPRRRVLSDAIARLPVEVRIYQRTCERYVEPARQDCIKRLTEDLLVADAHRLVLDTRGELDKRDEETIRKVFAPQPFEARFNYEHVDSTYEALLWVADAAAWCFGASGMWRKRVDPIVSAVIDLD